MTLILLPNLLSDDADIDLYFPKKLKDIILSLDGLIAENEKNARHYLLKFLSKDEFQKIKIELLNEHSTDDDLDKLLKLICNKTYGLISDSGLPCIADPGSQLVKKANQLNINVTAVTGPSSIFLALMLSGLNGQRFSFHGYLPKKDDELIKKIRSLENESLKNESTQIFIEAPYRSDRMLNILKTTLKDDCFLTVAINLTGKDEKVITKKIKEWKLDKLIIGKVPTIFLFNVK
jgi:16S rRNA (cytidine1402-2'-O)-methyltransferase